VKADVSKAAVVLTNPTHYAVALGFDFATMEAAQDAGQRSHLLAEEIKAEARWAGVPIIENPPLARSLTARSRSASRFQSISMPQWRPFLLISTGSVWRRRCVSAAPARQRPKHRHTRPRRLDGPAPELRPWEEIHNEYNRLGRRQLARRIDLAAAERVCAADGAISVIFVMLVPCRPSRWTFC